MANIFKKILNETAFPSLLYQKTNVSYLNMLNIDGNV